GTARRQLGVESPQQDRRHNARQLHRRVRLSCARPQPTGRTHSAGTRWQAVVKQLLPEEYLLLSPTNDHLPILRPLTISGQAKHAAIGHSMRDELHGPLVTHVVKEATNVRIDYPVHSFSLDAHGQGV